MASETQVLSMSSLCYSPYWLHPQIGSKPVPAIQGQISRHESPQRQREKLPSWGSLSGKRKFLPEVPQHDFSFVLLELENKFILEVITGKEEEITVAPIRRHLELEVGSSSHESQPTFLGQEKELFTDPVLSENVLPRKCAVGMYLLFKNGTYTIIHSSVLI